MTTETAHKWLDRARHDARPGSRDHRAGAVETSSDKEGAAGNDPRSCFLVTEAGPLRFGQDLSCSAVLAGVALLLSHRDHEPRASSKIRNMRGMNRTVSETSNRVRAGRRHKFARLDLRPPEP